MTRPHKEHQRGPTISEFGRSYCYIQCPYCENRIKAYIWSLSGGGKACPCGAKHTAHGVTLAPLLQKGVPYTGTRIKNISESPKIHDGKRMLIGTWVPTGEGTEHELKAAHWQCTGCGQISEINTTHTCPKK